jgi:hypothetical protein
LLINTDPDPEGPVTKSGREIMEIMEIMEAFSLTRCAHSAALLAGCDEKAVARYVTIRDAGGDPLTRPRSIDVFVAKVEEWVEHSQGRVLTAWDVFIASS